MLTVATLFGGMGAMEVGAMDAGLRPLWSVEHDREIAEAHEKAVGSRCLVAPVEDVDYSTLEAPFWLHMSPVCTNASVAKTDAGETELDRIMARGCARAIRTLRPREISLENVWGYRKFDSFGIVCEALRECGYGFNYWHLNAADYGVPQTRKRLILLASQSGRPSRPRPTHAKDPGPAGLFGEGLAKWVGWYEAIEDLIPSLPESKFAEWQLKRLPEQLTRSILAHPTADCDWFVTREEDEPSFSILANGNGIPRAFIVDGKPANYAGELQINDGAEPVVTITASQTRHPFRAFIVEGSVGGDRPPTVRYEDEPAFTYTANNGTNRHNPTRAWLAHGRVVSMTPRALARFQSIPDRVPLPGKNGLACKVIGNAVASLLAQRLVEHRLGELRMGVAA